MPNLNIVLIEDNVGHARLIERNLRRGIPEDQGIEIHQIHDGSKALQLILDSALGFSLLREKLVFIMDINLPGTDGFQILETLKQNPRTQHIPIFVLTSTDNDLEIQRCYELGCNAYIVKSVNYDTFCRSIHTLGTIVATMSIGILD